MTDGLANNEKSYLYLGLAGETGSGRLVQSGLYRLIDGSDEWEQLQHGLPQAPAVRALAVHPHKPEIVYAGTQSGPYRSADNGEHWERIDVPDHGLPVWSLLFHPRDPDVIFIGYENCEIYRSDDTGDSWSRLPLSVRFPEITTAVGARSDGTPIHTWRAIAVTTTGQNPCARVHDDAKPADWHRVAVLTGGDAEHFAGQHRRHHLPE